MKQSIRKIQKEQTKQLLLETAFRLFSERGILNTRMSDIAAEAGVSHGTVFLHFKTQEELITEVIEIYGGKIALRTHELAGTATGIRQLLAAHLSAVTEYEAFYTRLVVEHSFLPLGARDQWLSIQSAIAFHFGQVLHRQEAEGKCLPLPVEFQFNAWIGLLHHYLANGDLFAPGESVLKRYGAMLTENYAKLLCK